jgi:hypothetical protein
MLSLTIALGSGVVSTSRRFGEDTIAARPIEHITAKKATNATFISLEIKINTSSNYEIQKNIKKFSVITAE